MNPDILQYIKQLTTSDTKTLSQKLGKTMEEAGELARAILPFDGAAGTLHRFTDRNQILEECVDVVLTALSIAYQIGCDDQDFEDMMLRKCKKWGGLQAQEEKLGDKPIPYEIHITTEAHESNFEEFREACKRVNVKPIIIDMQTQEGTGIQDIMTSSVHFGDNRSAHDEMQRICDELSLYGFIIVRKKIETVPWHPAAPQTDDQEMPKDCYFESHIAVTCYGPKRDEFLKRLEKCADFHHARLSRNAFKHDDESWTKMITLRVYEGTYTSFQALLDDLVNDLRQWSELHRESDTTIEVDKVITEFSIYDTNVTHDAAWIG